MKNSETPQFFVKPLKKHNKSKDMQNPNNDFSTIERLEYNIFLLEENVLFLEKELGVILERIRTLETNICYSNLDKR